MIYPLRHLSVSGFLWYQGESNKNDGAVYTQVFAAMIRNWRTLFAQGDLPFIMYR
ncbi:sialate O-acetylesterase [Paraflavitalea speifideaquila]|uniref:sialate O-acetylesterase n=1 Tax=Paraflavitalea speifideaquila TaxID=3076558 RepID=UPI0028E77910|nr:sialate O-acetylesterase [Paraflavitalea speifideiaquila]